MIHKRHKGKKRPISELIEILHQMKQEEDPHSQKQSVTIEGFVARDEDGALNLFGNEPERLDSGIWVTYLAYDLKLPTDSFPDLKWEDEPLKCKITIEEV